MTESPERDPFSSLASLAETRHAELVRVAKRIVRDDAEAEDVVQDTLALVWQRRETLQLENVEAYLFRAVHINALKRRARRRQSVSFDEQQHEGRGASPPSSGEDDPLEIEPETLEEALGGLPETQQAVIRLKYYVGLTFREIAESLSISNHTAASRCRYALDALRAVLGRKPK